MRLFAVLAALQLMLAVSLCAQTALIEGKVVDEDERPIATAMVRVLGHPYGAKTGADGSFRIVLPLTGEVTLRVFMVTFKVDSATIHLSEGKRSEIIFHLQTKSTEKGWEGCPQTGLPTRVGTIRTITFDERHGGSRPMLFGGTD